MADPPLDIRAIRELIPHRYPMLMIDRVVEVTEDGVVAEKVVSANEPFFQGHFPDRPVMPGVLIVEAMAQAAAVGVMIRRRQDGLPIRGVALAGIEKARFRRAVGPGDVLQITVRRVRARGDLYRIAGSASVDGERTAEAELLAALVDWEGVP